MFQLFSDILFELFENKVMGGGTVPQKGGPSLLDKNSQKGIRLTNIFRLIG